jgi:hypothetical protein
LKTNCASSSRNGSRPGGLLVDGHLSAPHCGAEPLHQPRFPDDQAIAACRAGEWAIARDEADADVRWRFRQQLCSGVAKAALIEDEEVEAGEVRCDQGELLPQQSLRQAQRGADDEPVRLGVEEHERAKVAPTGKIEAGNDHDPSLKAQAGDPAILRPA